MKFKPRLYVFLVFHFIIITIVVGEDGILEKLPVKKKLNEVIAESFCIPRTKQIRLNKKQQGILPNCALPSDEIVSGRALPGSYIHPTPFPPWMNVPLAQKGQLFAIKNKFSIAISALKGLMTGLPLPDALQVLSFTGLSGTGRRASKRYVATGIQMFIWYEELLKSNLSSVNDVFLTSITNVRTVHTNVARKSNSAPKPIHSPNMFDNVTVDDAMWNAVLADLAASNITQRDYSKEYYAYDSNATYVNQFAQGVTLIGIAGYALMDPQAFLIWDSTEDEMMGYLHLWAIVGYIIGVQDDYNVCLQPSVQAARDYFFEVLYKYAIPGFFQIDKIGKVMVEALLKGANIYVPGLGLRPILYRLLRDNFKIPPTHLGAIMTTGDLKAQNYWDNELTPSTHVPLTRLALNKAVEDGINDFGLTMFGPYRTNKEKAQHCFINEENADKTYTSNLNVVSKVSDVPKAPSLGQGSTPDLTEALNGGSGKETSKIKETVGGKAETGKLLKPVGRKP